MFEIEYTLGESKEDEDGVKSNIERLTALKVLIRETIKISKPSIQKIQSKLSSRINWARKAKLGGSIVATICSAGVIATIAASTPSVASVVSFLALFAAIPGGYKLLNIKDFQVSSAG